MDWAVWNRRVRPEVVIWVTERRGELIQVEGLEVSLFVRVERSVELDMVADFQLLFLACSFR